MKTRNLLFILLLFVVNSMFSHDANQEFTNRMNYIFQYVDKSKIPTGLLSDYGMQMLEPDYFNGVPADSNYVDLDAWKMLYAGIYTSKINNNVSLTLPATVFSTINSLNASAVPLAMMHYQYNKLDDNAANMGLLKIVNHQIRQISQKTLKLL